MWRRRPSSSQNFLPYYTQTQRGISWWIPSLVPCNPTGDPHPAPILHHGWRFFLVGKNTGGSAVNITLCHQVRQPVYYLYSLCPSLTLFYFPQYCDKKTERRCMPGDFLGSILHNIGSKEVLKVCTQMALENQWLFFTVDRTGYGWWVRYQNLTTWPTYRKSWCMGLASTTGTMTSYSQCNFQNFAPIYQSGRVTSI